MRWVPLALVVACASQEPRGPFFGDEQHLVLGVQPEREAEAIVAQMGAAGFTLALRLRGLRFTALEFSDASGRPAAVRIVTARGIALALDTDQGHALSPRVERRLVPVRLPPASDASGGELVFVEERVAGRGECVRVYAVDERGAVEESSAEVDPRLGSACRGERGPDGGTPDAAAALL